MRAEAPIRPGIRAGVVSDVHIGDIESLWRFKGTLKQVRHLNTNVLILPGDIIAAGASEELVRAFTHVLREGTHSDKPYKKHMIPQVIFVEGNNEQELDPHVREVLYSRLERNGVTVFRSGQNNVAYIKNRQGEEVATVIGMPFTIPQDEYEAILATNPNPDELVEQYHEVAERIHTKTFEEDLQTAREKGLPTYIVFHASPDASDYSFTYGVDVRKSMLLDLMNRHDAPNIVGIFYGHTNKQGMVSVRQDNMAYIGTCEEVVNREGRRFVEAELFQETTLPLPEARRRFASQFTQPNR